VADRNWPAWGPIALLGKPVRGGGTRGRRRLVSCNPAAALAPALPTAALALRHGAVGARQSIFVDQALRHHGPRSRARQKLELAQGSARSERPASCRLAFCRSAKSRARQRGECFRIHRGTFPANLAQAFGLRLRIEAMERTRGQTGPLPQLEGRATVRLPTPRPFQVKEVLERLRVTGSSRVSAGARTRRPHR